MKLQIFLFASLYTCASSTSIKGKRFEKVQLLQSSSDLVLEILPHKTLLDAVLFCANGITCNLVCFSEPHYGASSLRVSPYYIELGIGPVYDCWTAEKGKVV